MYRALIIDDEPWSREVIKSLVSWESMGIEIAGEAEDGNMSLTMMESLRPDLVITDMRLPGLDGVALLKAINERFPFIKIVVISGYHDYAYLRQAVTSRAADYILKPVDPNELNAALAKCVDELDKKSVNENRANYAFSIFSESEERDTYFTYRKQLRKSLFQLDMQGVEETMQKIDERIIGKIWLDLMLIVEEFAAEIGIELKNVWEQSGRTFDGTAESLAHIFKGVLKEAVAFRHNRNRLDISDVVKFIDRHLEDQISLDTVANYFCVTKEHLSRSFKAHKGRNMTDYIIHAKMEKARDMIKSGLSIKHAVESMGYTDLAYFYRLFKKHFGITPGNLTKKSETYQKNTRKDNNILK